MSGSRLASAGIFTTDEKPSLVAICANLVVLSTTPEDTHGSFRVVRGSLPVALQIHPVGYAALLGYSVGEPRGLAWGYREL